MTPWITRSALFSAHGEGAEALASPAPWATFAGGHRAALAALSPVQLCPAISDKIERRDRACAHALLVAHRLLDGLPGGPGEASEVGVVLGTQLGCASVNDAYHRGLIQQGATRASPVLFGYTVPSAPVGEVAAAFQIRGHQTTLMAGRASGIAALAEARRAILLGRARSVVVLAGDVLSPDRAALLGELGEPPPIEAYAALLLEHPDHASHRGRSPLALLAGASLGRGHGDDAPHYLGASGLVELIAWLASPSGSFEVRRGSHGQEGWLRATRA